MQIKGLIINSRKEFVESHFGREAWQRVLAAISPEDRGQLADLVITAKWYPFGIGERLDKAIVDVLGDGDKRIFEKIGAESARKGLTKVHKTFVTKGDPQAFMKKAGMIYKFYYDTGYREYEETGPASGVLTTYEAETFSAVDCLTVIGWYREALKMCGARNVDVVEEECRARGGSRCRYRFEWDV
jgi:uncharacterized protein (TIGR02265 family)